MAEQGTSKKNITYVPPAPEVLEQVARGVCERMAESDPSFKRTDVVYGFAAFLNVMARMRANRLNSLKKAMIQRCLTRIRDRVKLSAIGDCRSVVTTSAI